MEGFGGDKFSECEGSGGGGEGKRGGRERKRQKEREIDRERERWSEPDLVSEWVRKRERNRGRER